MFRIITRRSTTTSSAALLRRCYNKNQQHQQRLWQSTVAAAEPYDASETTTATTTASGPYEHSITQPFPSLILDKHNITPVGTFAEAQATYLQPDEDSVNELVTLLQQTNTGIVAHYYMDVELQGILQSINTQLPGRVGIADSLKMGDMAVDMVKELNVTNIICLGVDFMSESVNAILHKNGYNNIPVYRATANKIGCSLAESAENDTYRAWLQKEQSTNSNALHVVYINTSLETKAISNSIIPTITCTSSNVLQTLLSAALQLSENNSEYKILYGPDTYMGENLVTLLTTLIDTWTDEEIQTKLHKDHTRETLKQLRNSINVYPSGNCIVHHMFGSNVVNTVKSNYQDSYVTAHLEVPGEMFHIAMNNSLSDNGVVGSTSDILNFITRKVQEKANNKNNNETERLKFILGTEAGMVTSIVKNVQNILKETNNDNIQAEIVFPVASDAVTPTDDGSNIVPGVTGGEGCSTSGGCATCPYMKMNNLDSVINVLEMINNENNTLSKFLPPNRLNGKYINGRPATDWGSEPIVYMREFNKNKKLPNELIERVMNQR